MEHGDPATKVDLVVLGDGYAKEEMEKFAADVRRLADELFAVDPFKSRRGEFNVWPVNTPGQQRVRNSALQGFEWVELSESG